MVAGLWVASRQSWSALALILQAPPSPAGPCQRLSGSSRGPGSASSTCCSWRGLGGSWGPLVHPVAPPVTVQQVVLLPLVGMPAAPVCHPLLGSLKG